MKLINTIRFNYPTGNIQCKQMKKMTLNDFLCMFANLSVVEGLFDNYYGFVLLHIVLFCYFYYFIIIFNFENYLLFQMHILNTLYSSRGYHLPSYQCNRVDFSLKIWKSMNYWLLNVLRHFTIAFLSHSVKINKQVT